MGSEENKRIGAIVLAGNAKIKKQIRRRKRRGLFYRIFRPNLWSSRRTDIEANLASKINKDDYIVGENKSLLYLHPDLSSQRNLNFLKRTLYFAGKTGGRFYRKNKENLLEYLSRNGETSVSLVLKAVKGSNMIDPEFTIVIGPKEQILNELKRTGRSGVRVEDQGGSIGENILIGKKVLSDLGYSKDEILVIGGDLPLLHGKDLDRFMDRAMERGGSPDIRFGMGSRQELSVFIDDHNIASLGTIGPNYPKAGYLNKFGIPLIDDIGLFGKKKEMIHFMMGNIFLVRFEKINRTFIDRFYSLRKMGANPLTYPYLILHFGRTLFRAVRWKLTLTQAEEIFNRSTGVFLQVVPAQSEFTMDLDSYSDLRRLSSLYYHRLGTSHDLEMDLRKFAHGKHLERKMLRKQERKSGGGS